MDFSSSFRPPVQVDSLSNATGESLGVTQIPYIPLMEHQKKPPPEKEKKNRKKNRFLRAGRIRKSLQLVNLDEAKRSAKGFQDKASFKSSSSSP